MKVIELFNKIANGEELPKKFNFAHCTFTKKGNYYIDEDGDDILASIFSDFSNINDEIEIIEENKDIEEIDACDTLKATKIVNKLNEVIRKVNSIKGDE